MEIKETIQKLLQEMVIPDLSKIRDESNKILAILDLTNKRLDDVNTHLADQSQRIDETNKRIDGVRTELSLKMDKTHSDLIARLDANNERIDRFFLISVTKEEHRKTDESVSHLEREVEDLRRQIAA
ncbi:MAG: hypothetical protein U9O50_03110 [Acidobacteriota bacterium]|nr:hypothetical protein [Acidobacteriota bacterium]